MASLPIFLHHMPPLRHLSCFFLLLHVPHILEAINVSRREHTISCTQPLMGSHDLFVLVVWWGHSMPLPFNLVMFQYDHSISVHQPLLLKLPSLLGYRLKARGFELCSVPSTLLSPSEDHQATPSYCCYGVAVG